jgi:predicted Zn-dependent protease
MSLRNVVFLVILTIFTDSCTKNSITGRNQLLLVSEAELMQLSNQQYKTFLSQHKVVASGQQAEMVSRVGARISRAVTGYLKQKGQADLLNGYDWEFKLVEDANVNAWCMPGGKVVVYTGLMPVALEESGLAVVMGHEIAHAIARHGNERMSQGLMQQFGGIALSAAIASKPSATQDLFMTAYGVGSEVGGVLPFGRKQELEADRYGLIFAAIAGFDPNAAVPFWERMSKMSGSGGKQPELLSTHPSDETRIAKVREYAKEAAVYYKTSR